MLPYLDLFSGIGGFQLVLENTAYPVAFCDTDAIIQQFLKNKFPAVPVFDDVTTLGAEQLKLMKEQPKLITAGFPCQDISGAGRKRGISGDK